MNVALFHEPNWSPQPKLVITEIKNSLFGFNKRLKKQSTNWKIAQSETSRTKTEIRKHGRVLRDKRDIVKACYVQNLEFQKESKKVSGSGTVFEDNA